MIPSVSCLWRKRGPGRRDCLGSALEVDTAPGHCPHGNHQRVRVSPPTVRMWKECWAQDSTGKIAERRKGPPPGRGDTLEAGRVRPSVALVARERAHSHRAERVHSCGRRAGAVHIILRTSGANLRHHEQERGSRRRAGLGDMAERETPPQECTGDGRTDGMMDTRASGQPERREEGRRVVSLAEGPVRGDWTWFGTWAPERKPALGELWAPARNICGNARRHRAGVTDGFLSESYTGASLPLPLRLRRPNAKARERETPTTRVLSG